MTNPFRAQFDKLARNTFARHGMAEKPTEAEPARVTYTPAGSSTPIPCTLLIDRGVISVGIDQSQVTSPQIVITAYRDQIGAANPTKGARFVIGAETFTFDAIASADESAVQCVVKVGA